MAKLTLTDLVNLQNETTAVNAVNNNNAAIEAVLENTLSRDGTAPNQMQATLDMNSNPIINLPPPTSNFSPLRIIDAQTLNGGGTITVSTLPIGGTAGQALTKNSSTNFDAGWTTITAGSPSVAFETRAAAAGTTLSITLKSIRVVRYATGYPVSNAVYIPGTISGPAAFQEAGGNYWELDLTAGSINACWFGAIGDDATDNQTVLASAISYMASLGKTLVISQGIYRFSGNLNFASQSNMKTEFLGNVTLKHTGTGIGVSLVPTSGVTLGCRFGWNNPPLITGNTNTTRVLYVNNFDHAKGASRIGNGNSTSGFGCLADGLVLSDLDIQCSTNSDTFTSRPFFAIDIKNATDCNLNLINEGQINIISLETVQACRVTGTSEGNDTGGIFVDVNSKFNTFINFDCEANLGAASQDYIITGSDNNLIGCNGSSPAVSLNLQITGDRNCVRSGIFPKTNLTGVRNRLESIQSITSFVDGGTNTRKTDCLGPGSTYIATSGA